MRTIVFPLSIILISVFAVACGAEPHEPTPPPEPTNLKGLLEVIAPCIVACYVAFAGIKVVAEQIKTKGLNSITIQALALVLFIPTIIILSGLGEFESNGLATLLGVLAGYLFGKNSQTSQE